MSLFSLYLIVGSTSLLVISLKRLISRFKAEQKFIKEICSKHSFIFLVLKFNVAEEKEKYYSQIKNEMVSILSELNQADHDLVSEGLFQNSETGRNNYINKIINKISDDKLIGVVAELLNNYSSEQNRFSVKRYIEPLRKKFDFNNIPDANTFTETPYKPIYN